ncbi:MAG: LuxR C-terminal-related transcriptional regulator [Candidatus Thiodiazotropha taylori]
MDISEKTLETIAKIYDVGLNSENWPIVLEELCHHLDAAGSALFYDDSNNSELNAEITAYSQFWSNDALDRYIRYVQPYEPSEEIMRQTPPGIISYSQLMPYNSKFDIKLYAKNMWDHFGVCAVSAVRMNGSGAWYDYLTFQFQRGQSKFHNNEVSELKILLPHITKAIQISRPTALLKQRFKAVLDALDHLHIGVLILSSSHTVVTHNIAATKILEQNDGLFMDTQGRLKAVGISDHQTLKRLITQVIETSGSKGTTSGGFIAIDRRSGRDAFLLDIVPARDPEHQIDRGFHGAIVFCIDPTETRHISTHGVQKIYGLTKSETEICRLLVHGISNKQMAEMRNVSSETIKSQVQSILKKTRSINRSALIRLVLSINIPVDTNEQ